MSIDDGNPIQRAVECRGVRVVEMNLVRYAHDNRVSTVVEYSVSKLVTCDHLLDFEFVQMSNH